MVLASCTYVDISINLVQRGLRSNCKSHFE